MAVIDHDHLYGRTGEHSHQGNAALFLLTWVGFFVIAYLLNQIIVQVF